MVKAPALAVSKAKTLIVAPETPKSIVELPTAELNVAVSAAKGTVPLFQLAPADQSVLDDPSQTRLAALTEWEDNSASENAMNETRRL
jgi:hypothetical protein